LFGYKRGAFTGAVDDRVGLFQQADGGTLFLDEIGETSPAFQVKLLRVLQEGEFRPLGSSRAVTVDVRVIAATNHNLDEDLRSGRFREDLYFRLATIAIHVPPLRERPMDFPLLADRVLDASCSALGKTVTGFATDALAALATYDWPGNVRELQNEILRMVALTNGPQLGAELLSPRVRRAPAVPRGEPAEAWAAGLAGSLKERQEQMETRVLQSAMQRHRGNKSRVARELGLSRVGLRAKLARYGLEAGE
ncbi:MAG: sigma-54-dependent Fis family transcriptional regulator, partial [Dechloromonas sp.]|nr:sigma-54-dependent Fis family transcriptional regulator [Dechloromonas sp.]